MFDNLSDKLQRVFKNLRGEGKLSAENMEAALKEIRLALLEADVHFKVAKQFIEAVKEKAMGQEVLTALSPAQQVVKIVRDEMVKMLGQHQARLRTANEPPSVYMIVGLQGSGKTTSTGKLARWLSKNGHSPIMVSVDVYRPAARKQLSVLARDLKLPIYEGAPEETKPAELARGARKEAVQTGRDVILVDTAGRLHIDEQLMTELTELKEQLNPVEILFVADAMTGQDAVNQAIGFDGKLGLTGIILTKLDGDARGGAALSIRQMVGKPILFSGVGEKLDALEPFYPDRLASRILGMGDVLSLIDKVQQNVEQKEAVRLQQAFQKQQFTLEEFQLQLQQIKKMGSVGSLLELIPGAKKLASQVDTEKAEQEMKRVEAIINSMTLQERRNPAILNGRRRLRIAQGSGTTVTDVNRLMKQFMEMKKMMQRVSKLGVRSLFSRMPNPFQ